MVPSTELVAITGDDIEFLSASTGTVVHSLPITPPLTAPIAEQIAVDPALSTLYVAVSLGVGCPLQVVMAVDLDSGAEGVAAESALAPAVSPDGSRLAYIGVSGASCTVDTVTVENLRSGTRRSWPLASPGQALPAIPELMTLQWAPDGRHLVLGGRPGTVSGIEILDTDQPIGSDNAVGVGPAIEDGLPDGRYSDPAMRPDGSIVALDPYCWGGMYCPVMRNGTGVVALDAATGTVISTILVQPGDTAVGIGGLAVDPSGTNVAVVGGLEGTDLYTVSSGTLHLVAHGILAATWLPGS
ncbi:MAG: hypothetical protein WCB85_06185 [Candidatus Dormiibacterota bacterium]